MQRAVVLESSSETAQWDDTVGPAVASHLRIRTSGLIYDNSARRTLECTAGKPRLAPVSTRVPPATSEREDCRLKLMETLLSVLTVIASYSRSALFVAACVVAAACALSWATRTRRISPFTPLGRFSREKVDPFLRPVEAPVLNAGGSPASIPWWGLAAFVVLGILAQSLLGYIISILASTALGLSSGPRGALRALAQLTFAVLQIALMIRVLSSWFGGLARARWLRWTFTLTEPLLAPLRQVIPSVGPFDITPLILYYLLQFVGGFIVNAI